MRHLFPQLPELLADCALRLALDEFGADDEQTHDDDRHRGGGNSPEEVVRLEQARCSKAVYGSE